MSLYQKITEKLQFVSPKFYKIRYFKNFKNLTKENYSQRNIEPELIWIKNFLSKNAVIIDIGANVGSYVYQLEKKLSAEHIYAFEPNKKLYSRLKRLFPHIHIYPLALSDKNETAEFKVPIINGKTYDSRGTLMVDYAENGEQNHLIQQVKVVKLDDWGGLENLKKIDFIKIDVEGNEIKTLDGAKNTIQKFHPVLMVEIEQRHHEKPIYQIITEIENWNYTSYFLNRKNFELEKLTETIILNQTQNFMTNKKEYINNIIFLPKHPKIF